MVDDASLKQVTPTASPTLLTSFHERALAIYWLLLVLMLAAVVVFVLRAQLFAPFGHVIQAKVVRDQATGLSRVCCYLPMRLGVELALITLTVTMSGIRLCEHGDTR